MILVVLGTQDKTFERLIEKIDKEIINGNIKDEVIVQAGNTKYTSNRMKIVDFLSINEFQNLIKKCDLLITHGGAGSILDGIYNHKKVIAVPRLAKYKEHVNDHQLQIVREFSKLGYILGCENVEELPIYLEKVKTFIPKEYKSSNEKMLKIIEDFIEK